MTPEFAYFLKVNVAFALFYAFYRLFFYKDTFFKLRRAVLLAFFILALLYPLFNIQEWLKGQEPMAEVIGLYSAMLPEPIIIADAAPTDFVSMLLRFASYAMEFGWLLYGGVIVLFGLRFLMQLSSILILAYRSDYTLIHGVKAHLLNKPSGPFSFFHLIFLHPDSHSDKEIDEILTHECTHVAQWHSLDVVISELICILCWINPFVWLLKREVRHNLEYLADNTVIQSGYDSKSYQYHLLGLAHHQATATIYNSFNVLHLKNRISMMNKKRSRNIGKTKYLMFIPLTAVLMLLSNIEAVARITNRLSEGVTDQTTAASAEIVVTKPLEPNSILQTKPALKYKKGEYLTTVDVMPRFPGGDSELLSFLNRTVNYPKDAQIKGIQGRVIASFVVGTDGSINDVTVLDSIDPLLDAEAVRVLRLMPKWTPGKNNNKLVPVLYTVPITFSLKRMDQQKATQPKATSKQQEVTQTKEADPSNQIFRVVDVMPSYPGGDQALLSFISSAVKYPMESQTMGVQGRVSIVFVVEKNGTLSNPEVLKGVDPLLDAEAIRVIKSMPAWKPGTQRGKAVRVLYTVPITFKLK